MQWIPTAQSRKLRQNNSKQRKRTVSGESFPIEIEFEINLDYFMTVTKDIYTELFREKFTTKIKVVALLSVLCYISFPFP